MIFDYPIATDVLTILLVRAEQALRTDAIYLHGRSAANPGSVAKLLAQVDLDRAMIARIRFRVEGARVNAQATEGGPR